MKVITSLNFLIMIKLISADQHLTEIKEVGFIHPQDLSQGEIVRRKSNQQDEGGGEEGEKPSSINFLALYRNAFKSVFTPRSNFWKTTIYVKISVCYHSCDLQCNFYRKVMKS